MRISWDEAAQICADELKRMKETYGPEAVLCESDMHGEGKRVAPSHGCPNRLLALMGGYTLQMRNMDSWEGWYWGAKHVWGCEPVGEMAPTANLYPDIAQHSDLLLFWGMESETGVHPNKIEINAVATFRDGRTQEVPISLDLSSGAGLALFRKIPINVRGGAAAGWRNRLCLLSEHPPGGLRVDKRQRRGGDRRL